MQRYLSELDHKRFGCSKMRDIVGLLLADIAYLECTTQMATVLMPLAGVDYTGWQGGWVGGAGGLMCGVQEAGWFAAYGRLLSWVTAVLVHWFVLSLVGA